MILDMIQGCRYLRRSTDRWLLSKNSTTRLKGLKRCHGSGLLWNCLIPITNTKGSYLYPCPNTTPSRPRLQHLLLKLMPRRQCPSCTHHQFVPSLHSGHVITYSRMLSLPSAKQPFCRMKACSRPHASLSNALLPNSAQVSLFPVPIFGVKTLDQWPKCQCPKRKTASVSDPNVSDLTRKGKLLTGSSMPPWIMKWTNTQDYTLLHIHVSRMIRL
jgi:hypothetical protein